jgi:hypothetical protein
MTARRLPRLPHGCLACRPHQRHVRRHGSRVRTARSARARRRPFTSAERLPAPLRPTARHRRSFRGQGLRRASTVYRLDLPVLHSIVRRLWVLSRQTTLPLYLVAPSGPVRLLRRTANGCFRGGEGSAVTLARAGSMFRFYDPVRQHEKAGSTKFSVHKTRQRTQFLHRFSTEAR